MKTTFIDHIVLLISDLKRSEEFYSKFLGEPLHKDNISFAYKIGDTKIFFGTPKNINGSKFDKENIGLNHIAIGVRDLADLKLFQEMLNDGGIKNSGIQIDKYGGKEFIWFDDPDGIRLEFYLRLKK